MSIEFLLEIFDDYGDRPALIWRAETFSYAWLASQIRSLDEMWAEHPDVSEGAVVGLNADYSPSGLSALLSLLGRGHVVCPLTDAFETQKAEFFAVAEVSAEARVDESDTLHVRKLEHTISNPLLSQLADSGRGGLILFSSGSSGKSKAVVHDGRRLLESYRTPRRPRVTIPFMLFDHIGGINTVLHVLSSGGTAVVTPDRGPETVCRLIAEHKVEVLPATPTFLRLLLLSNYVDYDLSSLEILAYGAERMPEAALQRLAEAMPNVTLMQNYGMSEVGILKTKSEASDSLWMKLEGDGFETRVRDGCLEIKAETAMLGYLNEVQPFTEDGWLKTGDRVEVKGDYIRVLGRASDIIIVGGEKVYPAEVEDLILSMPDVVEAVVSSEENAITGHIVKATVRLSTEETRAAFRARMTAHLSTRLAAYKIPQRVRVTKEPLHSARQKGVRRT